jgi:uncharacterized membrane protein
VVFGIHQISDYLIQHFPAQGENENVLPNQAIIL